MGGTYFAKRPISSRPSSSLSDHNGFSVSALKAYRTPCTSPSPKNVGLVLPAALPLYGVDAQRMPLLLPFAEIEVNPPGMAPSLLVTGAVIVLVAQGVVLMVPVVELYKKERS